MKNLELLKKNNTNYDKHKINFKTKRKRRFFIKYVTRNVVNLNFKNYNRQWYKISVVKAKYFYKILYSIIQLLLINTLKRCLLLSSDFDNVYNETFSKSHSYKEYLYSSPLVLNKAKSNYWITTNTFYLNNSYLDMDHLMDLSTLDDINHYYLFIREYVTTHKYTQIINIVDFIKIKTIYSNNKV